MVRYSVIIPHYNIPDLLMRCLDSIPERDDIQVIVVDDHSPGGDALKDKYPRLGREGLTFFRAPRNGGIGYARNLAIPYATGTWIMFCDADDSFTPDAFAIMDGFAGSDAQIVYFRPRTVVDGDWTPAPGRFWLSELYDNFSKSGNEKSIRAYHVPAWSKMFRREWLLSTGHTFEEVRFSEDAIFSIMTGYEASKVVVCEQEVYEYHLRKGSISAAPSSGLAFERARVAMRSQKLLMEKYSYLYEDAYNSLVDLFRLDRKGFWKLFRTVPEHGMSRTKVLRKLFHLILSWLKSFFK